jgi:transcriptional regulator with XRE-family HTH domain
LVVQVFVEADSFARRPVEGTIMTAIITTVEQLCAEHGIDAKRLAERTGVDKKRVEAIVGERWTPSPQDRDLIAGAFGRGRYDVAWGHKNFVEHLYGCWGPL